MNSRIVLKCWNFPWNRHLGLWPPQRSVWIEFCLFIALCKYYLTLGMPLVQVGDGTVHIHCEGEHGFLALLTFHNSSSWLQVGAEHNECWWDSAAERSANWGVSPAYVGWGEWANPLTVILWALDIRWRQDDNSLKYRAIHSGVYSYPTA